MQLLSARPTYGHSHHFETTRLMKAVYPEARIIIVTDYDDAELRDAARAAGAEQYAIKENLFNLRAILEAGQQRPIKLALIRSTDGR